MTVRKHLMAALWMSFVLSGPAATEEARAWRITVSPSGGVSGLILAFGNLPFAERERFAAAVSDLLGDDFDPVAWWRYEPDPDKWAALDGMTAQEIITRWEARGDVADKEECARCLVERRAAEEARRRAEQAVREAERKAALQQARTNVALARQSVASVEADAQEAARVLRLAEVQAEAASRIEVQVTRIEPGEDDSVLAVVSVANDLEQALSEVEGQLLVYRLDRSVPEVQRYVAIDLSIELEPAEERELDHRITDAELYRLALGNALSNGAAAVDFTLMKALDSSGAVVAWVRPEELKELRRLNSEIQDQAAKTRELATTFEGRLAELEGRPPPIPRRRPEG